MIHFLVGSVASVILVTVLHGRHRQHEENREHGHLLCESIHMRHPIQQNDKQEVDVGESVELLEQIPWQKRKDCVLRCFDGVRKEAGVGMLTRIDIIRHQMVRDNFTVLRFRDRFLVPFEGIAHFCMWDTLTC